MAEKPVSHEVAMTAPPSTSIFIVESPDGGVRGVERQLAPQGRADHEVGDGQDRERRPPGHPADEGGRDGRHHQDREGPGRLEHADGPSAALEGDTLADPGLACGGEGRHPGRDEGEPEGEHEEGAAQRRDGAAHGRQQDPTGQPSPLPSPVEVGTDEDRRQAGQLGQARGPAHGGDVGTDAAPDGREERVHPAQRGVGGELGARQAEDGPTEPGPVEHGPVDIGPVVGSVGCHGAATVPAAASSRKRVAHPQPRGVDPVPCPAGRSLLRRSLRSCPPDGSRSC